MVLALVGALLWMRLLAPGARRRSPERERLRGAARGDARLRHRRRLRLVLGDRRAGRGLLPRRRCPGRVQCASLHRARRYATKQASGSAASASPWRASRVAWIAAIALVGPLLVDREIKSQPAAPPPTATLGSAVEPRQHRPLDRALGGLALRAARPARRAAGRLPDRDRTATARRSNARTATGSCTTCAPRSSTRPATKRRRGRDLEHARRLNPQAKCLREGWNCG